MELQYQVHSPPAEKWLNTERKFAVERMDEMVSSFNAWSIPTAEDQSVRVPECGRAFITLLQTITGFDFNAFILGFVINADRYANLPRIEARLKFALLQVELLDDFRIRLVQVKAAYSEEPLGYI